MRNKEIISQLESLRDNSRSFLDTEEPDGIWKDDIEALDATIAMIKEWPKLARKIRRLADRLKHHDGKPCCRKHKAFCVG